MKKKTILFNYTCHFWCYCVNPTTKMTNLNLLQGLEVKKIVKGKC